MVWESACGPPGSKDNSIHNISSGLVCASKKRCVVGDLRSLKTAPKQTRGSKASSQRQTRITHGGRVHANAQWLSSYSKRRQKARAADQEARGSKPIPSRCHGNTNQTEGGKLKQEEHREWDDDGNTEEGRMVEVALAGWLAVKRVVHLIRREWQKVLPEGNFYPESHSKVVTKVEASKTHRR